MRSFVRQPRRMLSLFSVLLFALTAVLAHAQDYKSIVVFGDSLSDTGNDAHLSFAKYGFYLPGPLFDYTLGRFTDGIDTFPSAQKYEGVWVEQLAAMLPSRPVIKNSLDGGKNYAYGFAFTGGGTTPLTFGPYTITVDNVGLQITHYLATHPKIDDKTLFVVWGGANDVINATSPSNVVKAGINEAENIERLIDAGATQFIVPNLPPLGTIPRFNGSPTTSIPATQASILFNDTLALGLGIVHDFNIGRNLRIYQLDIFALINKIIASPSSYGLVNVTSKSQGVYPLNPDTYLFWDDLHPTTHGHNIVAITADELIERHGCMAVRDERRLDAWGRDERGEGTDADSRCVSAGEAGNPDK